METLIKTNNEELKASMVKVLNSKFLGRVVEAGEDREIFVLQDVKLNEDKLILNGLDDCLEDVSVRVYLKDTIGYCFYTMETYPMTILDAEDEYLEIFFQNGQTQIINFF